MWGAPKQLLGENPPIQNPGLHTAVREGHGVDRGSQTSFNSLKQTNERGEGRANT